MQTKPMSKAEVLEGHSAAWREGASRTVEISESMYMGLGRDSAGQWPTLKVVKDHADGSVRVYLNGHPVANPTPDMLAAVGASGVLPQIFPLGAA